MMGYSARQNPTARDAREGKLMSRHTLMGRMDAALENHANALRVFEAKIKALLDRVEKLEHPELSIPEKPTTMIQITTPPLAHVAVSARPCGCDPGANWTCEQHRTIA